MASQLYDRGMVPIKGTMEIIQILVDHGCPDITSSLDTSCFSEYPIHGGGFGDIYSGKRQDGMKVAVKCARYRREEEADRRNVKLMARELYAWSKCRHPNVLELLGLAQYRGQLATVSPWMENKTLPGYIIRNPNVNRLDMCRQVANGLEYLHQVKMTHGDLKGANVLVSDTGTAKLADFGGAKLKEYTLHFTTLTSAPYSLRWAAPEILNGSPPNTESDVYSLGMTILETVTGKVPYEGKPEMSVLVEIMINKHAPSRNDAIIEIQENKSRLWELMARCWNYDASHRPQAAEVHAQLALILNEPTGEHQGTTFSDELLVHFTGAYLLLSNNEAGWRCIFMAKEYGTALRMVGENQAQIIVDVNQNGEATFETRHAIANANGITTLLHTVPAGADDVLPALISAARWNRLVDFANQEHPFASSFDMHFIRLAENFNDYDSDGNRTRRAIGPNLNETGTVHVSLNGADIFGLELINRSERDLYHSLFYFDVGRQAIYSCYPKSSSNTPIHASVRAKSTFSVGFGPGKAITLGCELKAGEDFAIGILKLFIATSTMDLHFLEQASPFDGPHIQVNAAHPAEELGLWDTISMTLVQRRAPNPYTQIIPSS